MAVTVRGERFVDRETGRTLHLRGINCSGDSKLPLHPDIPSHVGGGVFWESDNVSFVGRPFPLADADTHFSRIASWGFNAVRFVLTWEAVEHAGPGIYDEAYIDYVVGCLRACGRHGLYAIMDPHQDVWSRYSGGSGAPYWTLAAAGIDPRAFAATEAALVHNTAPDVENYPEMIWSTNYERAAVATMFTLFWAGATFAPRCVLNGVSVQEYLQSHFIDAMAHVALRIHEAGSAIEGGVVIGWESLNEPAPALVGHPDLGAIPKEQKLRKGTCPTMEQAFLLAAGVPQTVQTWDFGKMGPRKTGTRVIDPQGSSIWADGRRDDAKYGFERAEGWQSGVCIWQQHGVHDGRRILRPQYFHADRSDTPYDDAKFLDDFWMPHFRRFKAAIRRHHADAILFCQPPVLKIPPVFSAGDRADTQIAYAPHFYDGLTLVTKHWNTWYNVDVLGVLRGRYLSEVFAVKFGLRAIRNCLRDQLRAIRKEGRDNMGAYPCLFTEIGIPFDMDDGRAYREGDYTAQVGALDANAYALEGAGVHHCWWQYSALNTNRWGDFWNGEDLSFYSNSSAKAPPTAASQRTEVEVELDTDSALGSSTTLSTPISPSHSKLGPSGQAARTGCHFPASATALDGTRAHEAFLRPAPILTAGTVVESGFDLSRRVFELVIDAGAVTTSSSAGGTVTECFVPACHFARLGRHVVDGVECDATPTASPGRGERAVELDAGRQLLTWRHPPTGTHTLRVYGVSVGDDGRELDAGKLAAEREARFC